jgi:hypothetical protein
MPARSATPAAKAATHNRRYATLAGELGLEVAHVQPIGWSATSVPEPTAARYADVLAELAEALVLWRRAEQANPAGPGRSRNALACACGCGRRIRVARSVLALAPSSVAAASSPSSPRTTSPVGAYVPTAGAIYRNRMELGSCRGLGAGM